MEKQFRELLAKMNAYSSAIKLMAWDLRTSAPKKGVPARAQALGMLSTEVFLLSTSDLMETCLCDLEKMDKHESLDEIMKASVKECRRNIDRVRRIPKELYREFATLTAEAESVWEEAKNRNDFAMFRPWLEKIVGMTKQMIGHLGYEKHPYDALLEDFEPGMTVEKLDPLFAEMRARLVPLLARIKSSPQPRTIDLETRCFDPEKQKAFSLKVLERMGYDFQAGRLDASEHPFTIGITSGDVRITTHYDPHDVKSALFGSIHEGGHGLYEQNIDPILLDTPLHTGSSMGVHESQSRFWENMVGHSQSFWISMYGELCSYFPEQLNDVSSEDFYRTINQVSPSLIRVEADELTYNLHIMIRYEIEKALLTDQIGVSDLPRVWNEKMQEYLGLTPPDDKSGVLQDVHWAGGGFGYFPSYALGNLYSAQILQAMKKDIPDFEDRLRRGELLEIKDWLVEKIHRFGKLKSPGELLRDITGREMDSRCLLDYLENKYAAIYPVKESCK